MFPRNLAAALAALPLLLFAAAPAADAGGFPAAEAAFRQALAGAGDADEAVRRFEPLAAAAGPQAPLHLAYLGAAQTLQGRDAWLPWTKVRATERGLDNIDKALRRLTPQHETEGLRGFPVAAEVRLVAISTFLAVPDTVFHRADRGRQMLKEALARPDFGELPADLRRRYADLGQ